MTTAPKPQPYSSSPIFDETTLPDALRREHRTKPGVWAILRMLEGEVKLIFTEPSRIETLSPDHPGLLRPDEPHYVEATQKLRMQIDLYKELPASASH